MRFIPVSIAIVPGPASSRACKRGSDSDVIAEINMKLGGTGYVLQPLDPGQFVTDKHTFRCPACDEMKRAGAFVAWSTKGPTRSGTMMMFCFECVALKSRDETGRAFVTRMREPKARRKGRSR